ncbi:MAG: energy transducer TonB [Bryobacteraceae bacterium]|nr:energy transducer TonB [Bryobacteraceae bacterium]
MKTSTLLAILSLAVFGFAARSEAQVRLSDAQAKQAAVVKVVPEYPAMARQMRLSGRVELEATIDTEGNVEKVQVVSGNPLLSSAAVTALKKWKFNPVMEEGKPVRATASVVFDFKL